jgi:hypothetical protein
VKVDSQILVVKRSRKNGTVESSGGDWLQYHFTSRNHITGTKNLVKLFNIPEDSCLNERNCKAVTFFLATDYAFHFRKLKNGISEEEL